jgi:hypothetical protein
LTASGFGGRRRHTLLDRQQDDLAGPQLGLQQKVLAD